MSSPNAPTREIGYAQTPIMSTTGVSSGQWWMFEDETTPELRWPQSVFVYDQMRRQDSQVVSVLRAVTLPVRRTPWRIDPAGARDEVVQLVAEDLGLPIVGRDPEPLPRTKDRFSWPDHLREALLMLPFGHMYFEQTYRIVEGLARLRKLGARMPKTIEQIDVARDGGLIAIRQYGIGGGVDQPPIPVSRLVAYVHEKEGGNWLGFSLLRPAYKNWLLKDRLLRVQAQTIERNGMGIPTYEAAETEQDLSKGLGLATSLRAGEAAGAAIPNGAKLRLMGVEGELPDAEPAIRYHDEQIGRAVLAHFLNLGTQTGSWALGSTFADFFTLSLQTLAMQIADVATQHIIEDLVDLNFGEGEPAPKLVFDEIGSRQAATAEAIRALVDAGVITPDEVLERAVRQQFGLPSKDPDAEPVAAQEPEDTELYASARPPVVAAPIVPAASVVAAQLPLWDDDSDLDDDPIGELDDDTLILLQAMFELDVERGAVQAAGFNPELHKRWPRGHPKAGKFRPMVTLLKMAIAKHDGSGHPFQNFKREQLRKAAKARGIGLNRGEDKDSIAAKLLADLGGKPAKPKVDKAAPAKKAARKATAPARNAGTRTVLGTDFSPAMHQALTDIEDSGGMQKQRSDFQLESGLSDAEMDRLVDGGFVEVDDSAGGGGYIAATPRGTRALAELAAGRTTTGPAKKATPAKKAVKKAVRKAASPATKPALPAGVEIERIQAPGATGEVAYKVSFEGEHIGTVNGDEAAGQWLPIRPLGSSWALQNRGFKPSREAAVKELADSYKAAHPSKVAPSRPSAPAPPPTPPAGSEKLLGSLIPDSYRDAVARDAEIKQVVKERLNGTYAGLTVKVRGVDTTTDSIDVEADILDVDGRVVGETHRSFRRDSDGNLWVYHALLTLQPRVQGQGFAEAWNGHLMNWYSESGLDRVEVTANIDVGGYTWARQGFDFKSKSDAEIIASRLKDQVRLDSRRSPPQYDADQIAAAEDIIDRIGRLSRGDPDFPTAYEVSQVGRPPGAGRTDPWPGKDAMLGSYWSGIKPVPALSGAAAVS